MLRGQWGEGGRENRNVAFRCRLLVRKRKREWASGKEIEATMVGLWVFKCDSRASGGLGKKMEIFVLFRIWGFGCLERGGRVEEKRKATRSSTSFRGKGFQTGCLMGAGEHM